VQQAGTPKAVYDEPVNPFVMQFIGGANVVRDAASAEWYVRPRDLRIETQAFGEALPGTLERIIDLGDRVQCEVRLQDGQHVVVDLDASRARELAMQRGAAVWVEATRVHSFGSAASAA
jgi:sulfate/thiosulfate transport system ATP-binding protein